jgi:hypothetical protein
MVSEHQAETGRGRHQVDPKLVKEAKIVLSIAKVTLTRTAHSEALVVRGTGYDVLSIAKNFREAAEEERKANEPDASRCHWLYYQEAATSRPSAAVPAEIIPELLRTKALTQTCPLPPSRPRTLAAPSPPRPSALSGRGLGLGLGAQHAVLLGGRGLALRVVGGVGGLRAPLRPRQEERRLHRLLTKSGRKENLRRLLGRPPPAPRVQRPCRKYIVCVSACACLRAAGAGGGRGVGWRTGRAHASAAPRAGGGGRGARSDVGRRGGGAWGLGLGRDGGALCLANDRCAARLVNPTAHSMLLVFVEVLL